MLRPTNPDPDTRSTPPILKDSGDVAPRPTICRAVALVAITSLGWNIVAHFRSVVRVRVTLTCGVMADGTYYRREPAKQSRTFGDVEGDPVFGVVVQNVGRLPAVVSNVMFGTKVLARHDLTGAPSSPPLPHTIAVSADAVWVVPASDAQFIAENVKHGKRPWHRSDKVRFTVLLGNGKKKRTKRASARKALAELGLPPDVSSGGSS